MTPRRRSTRAISFISTWARSRRHRPSCDVFLVKYLPLLWAGLFRKKTRTLLTLASIVVAFLLFGLLQAVQMAFESGADAADAKRLLTTARYSIIEPLPIAYLKRIEQVPGVVGVAYA